MSLIKKKICCLQNKINEVSDTLDQFSLTDGQVKLNSFDGGQKPTITGWVDGVPQQFVYGSPLEFSSAPTTSHPENGPYPMYDPATGAFLEDPIEGVVTIWRVIFSYTNKGAGSNLGLTIGLVNIDNGGSSFIVSQVSALPTGETQTVSLDFTPLGATNDVIRESKNVVYLMTIADAASIGTGYRLFGATTIDDGNFEVEIESVTKITLASETVI